MACALPGVNNGSPQITVAQPPNWRAWHRNRSRPAARSRGGGPHCFLSVSAYDADRGRSDGGPTASPIRPGRLRRGLEGESGNGIESVAGAGRASIWSVTVSPRAVRQAIFHFHRFEADLGCCPRLSCCTPV